MNIKQSHMRLGRKGLDNFLSLLGFPPAVEMDNDDWNLFQLESNIFVQEEDALDLERTLLGERVYQKEFNHVRPIDQDEGWADWENYLEDIKIADIADELLQEYEQRL